MSMLKHIKIDSPKKARHVLRIMVNCCESVEETSKAMLDATLPLGRVLDWNDERVIQIEQDLDVIYGRARILKDVLRQILDEETDAENPIDHKLG